VGIEENEQASNEGADVSGDPNFNEEATKNKTLADSI